MAIFSATNLIWAIVALHGGVAYLLLSDPRRLAEMPLVVILGEAMQIPHATLPSTTTEIHAFTALILGLWSLSDLNATALSRGTFLSYWTASVPGRLFALFALTAWVYLSSPDPSSLVDGITSTMAGAKAAVGAGQGPRTDLFKNSLVFSAGFVELFLWFWVFLQLRDERKEFAALQAEEAEREARDKGAAGFNF